MSAGPKFEPDRYKAVAALFQIPEPKRVAFCRCLVSAVKEAWRGHGINHGLPRRSPVLKVLDKIRDTTPGRRRNMLQKPHRNNRMAATFLSCAVVPDDLDDWIETASAEELAAAVAKAKKSAERLRDSGQTPGTDNPAFDLFVNELYHFAAAFGGQPGNVSRKGSGLVSGTIPKLLEILKPELPEGFIPEREGSILNACHRAKASWEATA